MQKKYSRYFLVFISLVIVFLSFLIVKPYIGTLLSAIMLTYIFYPVYKRLNKIIRNDDACALIMLLLMILIVMIPIVVVANSLLWQVFHLYESIKELDIEAWLGPLLENLGKVNVYVMDAVDDAIKFVINTISRYIISIPGRLIELFILLFTSFYLFKEGPLIFYKIKKLVPLKESQKNILFREFNSVTRAIVYSIFAVALAQGITGGIGLFIFGVPNYLLWGVVMTALALIPTIGPGPVWITAGVWLIFSGSLVKGIGLLAYGVLVISTVDNIIRARIMGRRAKVHPITTLIGVLGGLKLFGLVGIIIGPLILSFFILLVKSYNKREFN